MSSHREHAEKVYRKAKCTNKKQLVRIHLWGIETIFSDSQPSIQRLLGIRLTCAGSPQIL